jgi:hypothetical protein
MRSEALERMRFFLRQLLIVSSVWLFTTADVFAQEGPQSKEVPNSMGIHTWFIILVFGAFLAWCISYSLQLHREALSRRKGREDLIQRREELLDQLADLEAKRQAGSVSEHRYKDDFKDLKFRLSKIIEKIGTVPPQARKTR